MIREQNSDKTLQPLLSEYNSVIELEVEQFSGAGCGKVNELRSQVFVRFYIWGRSKLRS